MGWNCFKTGNPREDGNGPKTMGQTLQEKFPRLYNLIQRVKEYGAPSRIKKRFRRRHRVAVIPTTDLTDRNMNKQTNCTEADKRGRSYPTVRRIEVAPAAESKVVDTLPSNGTHLSTGSHGGNSLAKKLEASITTGDHNASEKVLEDKGVSGQPAKQHVETGSGLEISRITSGDIDQDDLDKLADDLVEDTLDKVITANSSPGSSYRCSPETNIDKIKTVTDNALGRLVPGSTSQCLYTDYISGTDTLSRGNDSSQMSYHVSQDSDIDKLATALVDHSLRLLGSSSHSLQDTKVLGEMQNIEEAANVVVDHTLDISILGSSSQSIDERKDDIEKITNGLVDHALSLSVQASRSSSLPHISSKKPNIGEITDDVVNHTLNQSVLESSSQSLQDTFICSSFQLSGRGLTDNDIDEIATNVVVNALDVSVLQSISQSTRGHQLFEGEVTMGPRMTGHGLADESIEELTNNLVDHALESSVLRSSGQSLQGEWGITRQFSRQRPTSAMNGKVPPHDNIDMMAENAVDHALDMSVLCSSSQSLQHTTEGTADASLDTITNGVLDHVLDVNRLASSSQSLQHTTEGSADGSLDTITNDVLGHVLDVSRLASSSQSLQHTTEGSADGSLDTITNDVLGHVLNVDRLASNSQSLQNTTGGSADGSLDTITNDVLGHVLDVDRLASNSQSLQNTTGGSADGSLDTITNDVLGHVLDVDRPASNSQSLQNTTGGSADGSLDTIPNDVIDHVLDFDRLVSSSHSLQNEVEEDRGLKPNGVKPSISTLFHSELLGNTAEKHSEIGIDNRDKGGNIRQNAASNYTEQGIPLTDRLHIKRHELPLKNQVTASDQHIPKQRRNARCSQVKKLITASKSVK